MATQRYNGSSDRALHIRLCSNCLEAQTDLYLLPCAHAILYIMLDIGSYSHLQRERRGTTKFHCSLKEKLPLRC